MLNTTVFPSRLRVTVAVALALPLNVMSIVRSTRMIEMVPLDGN